MSANYQKTFLSRIENMREKRFKTKYGTKEIKGITPTIGPRPSKTIHETLECESEESHGNRESRRRRRPAGRQRGRRGRHGHNGASAGPRAAGGFSPGGGALCGGIVAGPSEEEQVVQEENAPVKCPDRNTVRYLRSSGCPSVRGFKRRSGCCW